MILNHYTPCHGTEQCPSRFAFYLYIVFFNFFCLQMSSISNGPYCSLHLKVGFQAQNDKYLNNFGFTTDMLFMHMTGK